MVLDGGGQSQCPTCMVFALEYDHVPELAQPPDHSEYEVNTHYGTTTAVAAEDTSFNTIIKIIPVDMNDLTDTSVISYRAIENLLIHFFSYLLRLIVY